MSLLVLSAKDVDKVASELSCESLITLMASVFSRLSSGSDFSSPHRASISMPDHLALFMPARVAGLGTAMKVVSVPTAKADQRGLPASTIVLDEATGAVKAILNARNLTALRTAAGSLLATQTLLGRQPNVLVTFGAGRQIDTHIDLHLRAFPTIKNCYIINRSANERLNSLISRLRQQYPDVKFGAHGTNDWKGEVSLEDLVHSADIICTATSSTMPLFRSSWVRNGTHVNLVGSYTPAMHEVDEDLIHRAGKVVVDSRDACQIEAGELIGANMGKESLIELGELVSEENGNVEVRSLLVEDLRQAGEITIFKSVGIGLQDVAIAQLVVSRAEEMSLGVTINSYDLFNHE